jgi:hypothetical protein
MNAEVSLYPLLGKGLVSYTLSSGSICYGDVRIQLQRVSAVCDRGV